MQAWIDFLLKFIQQLDLASLDPHALGLVINTCHITETIVVVILSWSLTQTGEKQKRVNWRRIEFVAGCSFLIFIYLIGDKAAQFKDSAEKADQAKAQAELMDRTLERLSQEAK
jgi:hypothetical protein